MSNIMHENVKKSNNKKAFYVLCITVIGCLVTAPFKEFFWGGFFLSIFTAGLVGGLTDWFAIKALFGKPLGISFKTNIIPRKREQILKTIVKMVEEDLLTVEILKKQVNDYDFAKLLLQYLASQNNKKIVSVFFCNIIQDIFEVIDWETLQKHFFFLIKRGINKINIEEILFKIVNLAFEKGIALKLLGYISKEISMLLNAKWFDELISYALGEIKKEYEGEIEQRSLLMWGLEFLGGYSQEELIKKIKMQFKNILEEMQDEKKNQIVLNNLEKEIKKWILCNNNALKITESNLGNVKKIIAFIVGVGFEKIKDEKYNEKKIIWLLKQIEKFYTCLETNIRWQRKLNYFSRLLLVGTVQIFHKKIGSLVYGRLALFSEEKLVEFIYDRVGNDLQMIRINGSLIGGATGAITYLCWYFSAFLKF